MSIHSYRRSWLIIFVDSCSIWLFDASKFEKGKIWNEHSITSVLCLRNARRLHHWDHMYFSSFWKKANSLRHIFWPIPTCFLLSFNAIDRKTDLWQCVMVMSDLKHWKSLRSIQCIFDKDFFMKRLRHRAYDF